MGVQVSIERARQLRKTMGTPEATLWNALRALRPLGYHFRRQVPLGRYYADFACHAQRLVIEVDGDTHGSVEAQRYDVERDRFIAGEGYRVLRVPNDEVIGNIEGVMTLVLAALEQTPTLNPSPQGGGKPRLNDRCDPAAPEQ